MKVRALISKLKLMLKKFSFVMAHSSDNERALSHLLHYRTSRQSEGPKIPLWRALPSMRRRIDMNIVTFNSEQDIEDLITSIIEVSKYPTNLISINIRDNASHDATFEKCVNLKNDLGHFFYSFSVEKGKNIGFGAAHNDLAAKGDAQFILVINPDCRFLANTISFLVDMAVAEEDEFAVFEPRHYPREHPKHYDPITWETTWNSHACVLIKRKAFEELHGYDLGLFMYCEDVELSYRFRHAGYRLKYCPHAVIQHRDHKTAFEVRAEQPAGTVIGNIALRLKFGRFRDKLVAILMTFREFAIFLLGLVRGKADFRGSPNTFHILGTFLKNSWRWIAFRPNRSAAYPFRGYGFELHRIVAECAPSIPVSQDLVTIITRTLPERRLQLKDAMVSVLNQTHHNIQWVIAQDGTSPLDVSNLGIPEELRSLVTIVKNPKSGRSLTGNKGLKVANGVWAKFLDDDDWLYADDIETLLNVDNDSEFRYGFAWTVPSISYKGLIIKEECPFVHPALYPEECKISELMSRNLFPIQSPIFRMRRDVYFPLDLEALEDWAFWRIYMTNGATGVRVSKTLSGFRVPIESDQSAKRQKLFKKYYPTVIQKY